MLEQLAAAWRRRFWLGVLIATLATAFLGVTL